MPMKPGRYPPDWPVISARIKARAGHRCERCGVPDGAFVYRPAKGRTVRIVLTVAHLDHDTTHNDDMNLACLCQRCHLNHDRRRNLRAAARTRARRRGQLELGLVYVYGSAGHQDRVVERARVALCRWISAVTSFRADGARPADGAGDAVDFSRN
ncbi:MAG: hypothetical protein M1546_00380 [Chloroflexi bacterium]|nr:hypothetical protein [Chloroflexota bacterium]